MPEDFRKRLEEELYKAYKPIISSMVRRGMVSYTNIYNSLGDDVSEEDKQAVVLKAVEGMANQLKMVMGEEG